ncbi:phage terminase small subunit P27 family [Larkinella insperata]|uniref:Phage terminase small subunit P27 family n=1 Tax=Larkinella insperata TaxID=332158 RepID=A0ABW3QEL2_9BACT|nr:phage terminase small subunit P27 family [Larkinella insperata]
MNNRRPRKPDNIKKLQGTLRTDRLLRNAVNPSAVSLPPAPDWLSEYAKEEWQLMTHELEQLRILTNMDLSTLAMYCVQVGIVRKANEQLRSMDYALTVETPNGHLQTNPLLTIINKASEVALKIAGQFGFSPSARTRIGTPDQAEDDPFENYLNNN